MCRFDGDGMVHACRIKGGNVPPTATAYVQTHRLKREVKQGFPLYLKGYVPPLHSSLIQLPGFNAHIHCLAVYSLANCSYGHGPCFSHEGMILIGHTVVTLWPHGHPHALVMST